MTEIINGFVSAINEHDVNSLSALMHNKHRLIDSQGNIFLGKDRLTEAWKDYFLLFPDYYVEIEDIISRDDTFVLTGFAGSGKAKKGKKEQGKHWMIPAAWKARVADNKVILWQVYADTKIPYETLQGKVILTGYRG